MRNKFNFKFKNLFSKMTVSYLLVIAIYVIIQALIYTENISFLLKGLLVPTCSYIIVAIGLNLVVGFAGDLSLGQAGFMCIGAFAGVSLANYVNFLIPNEILRVIIALLSGSLVAGLFGYLISIPVLKLSGDYLAIVTLAFGQIIKTLLYNFYIGYDANGFHFSFGENSLELAEGGTLIINGPIGITGNEKFSSFTVAILLVLITLFIAFNLIKSKYGRAIIASKENKIAASSVGINVTKAKTLAFVVSACLAGAGGALYGLSYTTITPAKFDFNLSIMILVYVVLGGLGNIPGTIIATICLSVLPELLRSLNDYRMIIYSIVLILVMLVSNNDQIKGFFKKFFRKDKSNV